MALLVPVHHHRTVSRVLFFQLTLLVMHVLPFSWHGAYRSAPAARSDSYSGWQPETFWWRNRRRNTSPQVKVEVPVGVMLSQVGQPQSSRMKAENLNLENSISKMGQPAYGGLRGRLGWGFLKPLSKQGSSFRSQYPSPHYVSFHYSTPVFSSLSPMNRRTKLNNVKDELDEEIMKNVISQVMEDQHRHPKSTAKIGHAQAAPPSVEIHDVPTPPPAQKPISSRVESKPHSRPTSRSFSHSLPKPVFTSTGFQEFPAVQDPYRELSGFDDSSHGSFMDPVSSSVGGFGEPVLFGAPQGSGFQETGGHFGHSPLGFGGFGEADTDIGEFGWRDPEAGDGDGFGSAAIKPIPTAIAEPIGAFSRDDKDCDTILTKSCTSDSECVCYGFYYCGDGKCRDITASSPHKGAVTFGDSFADGPAEKLGLSGRR